MIIEQLAAGAFFTDRRNVLSLDIFDTAVTRRLGSPMHVFAIVEQRLAEKYGENIAAGFATARVKAERTARISAGTYGREEVTLDEIYSQLKMPASEPAGFLDWAKTLEIEAEAEYIEPVAEILAAYQKVKAAGHRVIFVSDMYLPLPVIEKILSRCGYHADDKIYLSSVLLHTKHTGSIWEIVTADLDCEPENITHIGDNEQSDVLKARQHGVRAIFLPSWSGEHKRYADFSKAILPLSKLIASARKLGKEYIGNCYLPVLYGSYIRWVYERAQVLDADEIYFLSRDGHVLKRVWELFREQGLVSPKMRTSYLEVSRKVLVLASITRLNESVMQFLRGGQQKNRPVEIFIKRIGIPITDKVRKKILRHFRSTDETVEYGWMSEPLKQLLLSLEPEILEVCGALRRRVTKYLVQAGIFLKEGKKIIVDLGWKGNMQSALSVLCKLHAPDAPELSGIYVGLLKDAQQNRYLAGYMEGMICSDFELWDDNKPINALIPLFELLHGAPHGSVTDYEEVNGMINVKYCDNKFEKKQHDEVIVGLQNAALEKLRMLFDRNNESGVYIDELTPETYKETMLDLVMYPTRSDLAMLDELYHVNGFDHEGKGIHLVPKNDILPTNAEEALKYLTTPPDVIWVAGTLHYWIRLAKERNVKIPWLREVVKRYAAYGEEWGLIYSTY